MAKNLKMKKIWVVPLFLILIILTVACSPEESQTKKDESMPIIQSEPVTSQADAKTTSEAKTMPTAVCGNGIIEKGETGENCCQDVGCLGEQTCESYHCVDPICRECQYLENNKCVDYECCENADCNVNETCVSHKCEDLSCNYCQYIENHDCKSYGCCSEEDCAPDICENPSTLHAKCVELKKPELGQKIELIHSGDSDEKLDILFIPQRINDFSVMAEKISDLFYYSDPDAGGLPGTGLFNLEPFSDFTNKFNVAYVTKNIDEDYFECKLEKPEPSVLKWGLGHGCNYEKIKKEYANFASDYIVIIFDLPEGYHSYYSGLLLLDIDARNYVFEFVHEFGHQFGGLADEYESTVTPALRCGRSLEESCFSNYAESIKVVPNLDTLGCPKWCKSYDIDKLFEENEICTKYVDEQECSQENYDTGRCTWFKLKHPFLNAHCVGTAGFVNIGIDCLENTGCVYSADYGQLAFRPGSSSIMRGGSKFNKPSADHLRSILECCYPRKETVVCNEFREKLKNKIEFNEIVSCD